MGELLRRHQLVIIPRGLREPQELAGALIELEGFWKNGFVRAWLSPMARILDEWNGEDIRSRRSIWLQLY